MRTATYFEAYERVRDKLSYYQAQQGGDYSLRKKKAQRQADKFAAQIYDNLDSLIRAIELSRPFVQDMIGIASSARSVLPFIDEILRCEQEVIENYEE